MVKSESSKCGEASKGSGGGIDRISNLPDPLISQILSLLPTKSAVATSILSTRWKFLWTSINNLDFDNEAGSLSEKEYTHFVNRVLLLLDPPSVQNFHLTLHQGLFDPSCINSWISEAFGRTVQELDLVLYLNHTIELPLSHIYCNVAGLRLAGSIYFNIPATTSLCFPSLQTLHLDGITFTIPSNSSVSFPNLKSLYLYIAEYTNAESVHNLFSSCPVLDDLVISREDGGDDIDCLIIRIPSLTSLTLSFWCCSDYLCKLQIDTPALQYLDIEDEWPCEYFLVENLSSLLQAKLRLNLSDEDDDNVERFTSIFKCIGSSSTVKFLSVSGQILKAIITASANIAPVFHNITRLELDDDGDCLELSGVINFLESMDNLEHLVLKGWSCKHSHWSWWAEPLNVPKCLLSRVTTISFNYAIVDCCDQLELLRYLLKNAKVLQLLTISRGDHSEQKLQLLQKISMYPRGSETCQVKLERPFFPQM